MRRPEGCAVVVVRPGPLRTRLERRPAAEEVARVVGGALGRLGRGSRSRCRVEVCAKLAFGADCGAVPLKCWPSLINANRHKKPGWDYVAGFECHGLFKIRCRGRNGPSSRFAGSVSVFCSARSDGARQLAWCVADWRVRTPIASLWPLHSLRRLDVLPHAMPCTARAYLFAEKFNVRESAAAKGHGRKSLNAGKSHREESRAKRTSMLLKPPQLHGSASKSTSSASPQRTQSDGNRVSPEPTIADKSTSDVKSNPPQRAANGPKPKSILIAPEVDGTRTPDLIARHPVRCAACVGAVLRS